MKMTQTERTGFQSLLEGHYVRLAGMLRHRDGIGAIDTADHLDHSQHASERDLAMGALARDSSRMREVRAALHRVQSETFGRCAECGDEISTRRLVAVPWTTTCIGCRKAAEAALAGSREDFGALPLLHAA